MRHLRGRCDVQWLPRAHGAWSGWLAHAGDAAGTPPSPDIGARQVAGGWTCSRWGIEASYRPARAGTILRCGASVTVLSMPIGLSRRPSPPVPPIDGCATWAVISDFDGRSVTVQVGVGQEAGRAAPFNHPPIGRLSWATYPCEKERTAYRAVPLSHLQGCTGIPERFRTPSARISNRGRAGASPESEFSGFSCVGRSC